MRARRWLRFEGCALFLCFCLAACESGPAPTASPLGPDQPATLTEAVIAGDRTAVENFLALGADANEAESDGTTPLMRAVQGRSVAIAELLIAGGAYVGARNDYGVTPLYIAARAGDPAIALMLLAAGADANTTLPAGETVLMTAVKAGNPEVVRALLTGGEDVPLAQLAEQRASAGVTDAASYSAETNAAAPINHAEVDARERWYGRTALMIAAAEGYPDVVRLLVEAGSDVNLADEEGSTALSLARRNGHLEVATVLADAGATLRPGGAVAPRADSSSDGG